MPLKGTADGLNAILQVLLYPAPSKVSRLWKAATDLTTLQFTWKEYNIKRVELLIIKISTSSRKRAGRRYVIKE
jgi:hypothetical protein